MFISSIYLGIFDSFFFLRCLGTWIVPMSFQLKKVTKKSRRYAGRPEKGTGFPLLCSRHHAMKKLAEDAQTVFTKSS